MGFAWRYNLSGGPPNVQSFLFATTRTLTKGDIVTLTSGEIALGATGNSTFPGVFVGAEDADDESKTSPGVVEGTNSVTRAIVITNTDAVYGVADNNARLSGDPLDIAGATGAMTIASVTNTDFLVIVSKKADSDLTMVQIAPGEHAFAE